MCINTESNALTTSRLNTISSKGVVRMTKRSIEDDNQSEKRKVDNIQGNYTQVRAILFMAAASAIHFAGYELARSGTMALFTSSTIGFQSPTASPLSTICTMPFSLLLLWIYTKSLDRWGPRRSLFLSTVAFAVMMASGAWIIDILEANLLTAHNDDMKRMAQGTIFALNVAQSAFVQLLYTQHWSFLGSIAKDWAGATVWFAPIAGLGSIASTMAALCVQPLVADYGLTGLLWASSVFFFVSSMASDTAYRIAMRHHFEPSRNQCKTSSSSNTSSTRNPSSMHSRAALIDTSVRLFARVPALASLCVEVLACQTVSSIINFLFVLKVKECIPNDMQRATWTGLCYAWINGISGVLQFFVIPFWVRKDLQHQSLWLLMPLTMMVCATFMIYESEHLTLILVTASFSIYKVLEYSVRGVVVEMLYMSLDYESRFFGKEVIGLFVDRLGKSSTAIVLAVVTNVFGQSPQLDKAFVQALSVSSLMWLFASYPLAQHNSHNKVKVQ